MFKIVAAICIFFSSAIAIGLPEKVFAQTVETIAVASPIPEINAAAPSAVSDFMKMDFASKFFQVMTALYLLMWGIGEALTRISVWTENKWDNKIAAWISQGLWFIGAFAGRMGWKLPKLVIEHEAEKQAEKEEKKSA